MMCALHVRRGGTRARSVSSRNWQRRILYPLQVGNSRTVQARFTIRFRTDQRGRFVCRCRDCGTARRMRELFVAACYPAPSAATARERWLLLEPVHEGEDRMALERIPMMLNRLSE